MEGTKLQLGPICMLCLEGKAEFMPDVKDELIEVSCPHCRPYRIEQAVLRSADLRLEKKIREKLSEMARQANQLGGKLDITSDLIKLHWPGLISFD